MTVENKLKKIPNNNSLVFLTVARLSLIKKFLGLRNADDLREFIKSDPFKFWNKIPSSEKRKLIAQIFFQNIPTNEQTITNTLLQLSTAMSALKRLPEDKIDEVLERFNKVSPQEH